MPIVLFYIHGGLAGRQWRRAPNPSAGLSRLNGSEVAFEPTSLQSPTREEIADMAGTTPETTVGVLSRLKKLGVIDPKRGKITILDAISLREIGGCSYPISHEE